MTFAISLFRYKDLLTFTRIFKIWLILFLYFNFTLKSLIYTQLWFIQCVEKRFQTEHVTVFEDTVEYFQLERKGDCMKKET